MRIEKVEVSHFRGLVGPISVVLEEGLNVVHGPNEIGKTTLAEAIWYAMAIGAKGNTALHRSLKTHGGTEAPLVRLTLRDDGTSYGVTKSFGSKGTTKLTVSNNEQITNEFSSGEAEEELCALLGIGLSSRGKLSDEDRGPFVLSWVRQGQSALQPGELVNKDSHEAIQTHLAKITGEALVGKHGADIYEAAVRQCALYFTDKGVERSGADSPLKVARAAAAASDDALKLLREQEENHGVLVEQKETTRTKLTSAKRKTAHLNDSFGAAKKHFEQLKRIADERDQRKQKCMAAVDRHKRLTESCERRGAIRNNEATQVNLVADMDAIIERDGSKMLQLVEDVDTRTAGVAEQRKKLTALKRTWSVCSELAKLADAQVSLNALLSRHRRAEDARALRDNAQAKRDNLLVTNEALRELEVSSQKAREQRIKLDAAAASIAIAQHAEVDVRIDGTSASSLEGGAIERIITTSTTIEVGDLVTLTIRPGGTDLSTLEAAVEQSHAEFESQLERMKVESLAVAQVVATDRQEAEQDLKRYQQTVEIYAPEGLSALADEVKNTTAKVTLARANLEGSDVDVSPALDTDEADRAALAEAKRAAEIAVQAADEQLETMMDAATKQRTELSALKVDFARIQANRKNAEGNVSELRKRLKAEMEREGDDDVLNAAIGSAAIDVKAAEAELRKSDEQLEGGALEIAEKDQRDADRAVSMNATEIGQLESRLSEIDGRLYQTNMVGIHERIAEAEQAKSAADHALTRVLADASAARLLLDTLRKHKEATEQRFRRPLEESIQVLVQLLWPDAKIALDDQFHIDTIERPQKLGRDKFDVLSAGASEQLGLIARLAMAQILAKQRPVLVVLDDSLVVTDDRRFRDMARVINRVADNVQVIFLTCHWNRQNELGLSPHNVVDMEDVVNSTAV